jgi:iron complex transport system substrate-binding protein
MPRRVRNGQGHGNGMKKSGVISPGTCGKLAREAGAPSIRMNSLIVFLLLALFPQAPPKRIVSTFPSVTETLFALGVGDRVVGVSTYCRYPPAVLSLPKVGTYMKPDPEKIALLRPDFVIIERSATTLADRLSALHIPYAEVKVGSLDDVYSMILDIGRAVGCGDKAANLNNEIQSRLAAVRAETQGKPRPSVLLVVGRNPGQLTDLVGVGPGSYLAELLEIAGGRNVLAESVVSYPRISLETVVRLNPDVILDASMVIQAGVSMATQEADLREPWLPHRELAAVKNGLVFGLVSESLVTPGPRVVEAVDLLRAKIRQGERQP